MSNASNAALLLQNGHPELAAKILDAELAHDPENWEYHVNIGIAYRMTSQFHLALLHQKLATQLKPEQAVSWHNLGVTHTEIGEFDRAFLAHQKAFSLSPNDAQVCLGYAYALMRYGKFEPAWPLWEQARYNSVCAMKPRGLPLWTGQESLAGKKILVMKEGGFGDSIFFLRWLPDLQDRGAQVSFYAWHQQAPIFVGHPWMSSILTDEEPINPKNFDFCVSLMSLPALLKCSADKIPAAPRYIMANPEQVMLMRGKVSRRSNPLVGICWGAEEGFIPKKSRTIPDAEIEPLKDLPVDWVSLWPGHCLPWMSEMPLKDWGETAALICHLDSVVSVDTAVAHLAAAMGKPTKIVVPLGSDWKWFNNLTTSPWYPSVEVIHNTDPVKWKGAIDGVSRLLQLPHGIDSQP